MQFTTFIVSFMASAVLATPSYGPDGTYFACNPGLYSNAQCCATDVLGVADLDCATPSSELINPSQFKAVCASAGQRARCCVLPVAGQAVLCEAPIGI
ncbi:hydrophobin precursor [Annulohypoxylon maeteangense]|uniref:hydrophobin precursor n=1 Tax=Annulohypoxylon maeteangense TaxID=1927788 RepID=UPI0020076AA0|nr:hydrophobin precursor [Annulohypoxylon maeteangense]KAI0880093.1 hydrophobin precursor [Annulohypoxylon maeteangense]